MKDTYNPSSRDSTTRMLEPEPALQLTFQGLTICFDSQVLAPRSWTEAQSVWAAELLTKAPEGPVLELFAGVGHIGLGAVRDSSRKLVMVDFNPIAQRFAQDNAVASNLASRVEFRLARVDEALDENETYALVIADPPWVRTVDTSKFPDDPLSAINGGDDGLDLARTSVELVNRHLAQDGSALLQLGNSQQVALIADYTEQLAEGSVKVLETRTYQGGIIVRLAHRSTV